MADFPPHDPSVPPTASARIGFLSRLIVALLLTLGLVYVGYLAIALGPGARTLDVADFLRGEGRILQPAERRGALVRNGDRLYLLTTQQERIVPLWFRLGATPRRPRELLHADLWAFDATTANPVWRKRLRTFEGGGSILFELLGLDGGTLWLMLREPLGVTVSDGTVVADGQRIEAKNPSLAGKRVDQRGFVAFGGQGLQLTLSDSTQWVVAGDTLAAQPRATAALRPGDLVSPAYEASYTSSFQMRGLPIGSMWLGVLTDEEAKVYQAPPVIPGRTPGERRGAADDFYDSQHFPQPLTAQPRPYRLWSAKLTKVSAAPTGW